MGYTVDANSTLETGETCNLFSTAINHALNEAVPVARQVDLSADAHPEPLHNLCNDRRCKHLQKHGDRVRRFARLHALADVLDSARGVQRV